MKTCGKCIKFDFCKRYVTENESFPEMPKGCPEFKRKPLFKRKQKGVIQMTDKKLTKPVGNSNRLTDNEIIKACNNCLHYEACKGTYYSAKGDEDILYDFDGEMYANSGCEDFQDKDLINRQQAEIERLKAENSILMKYTLAESKTTATAIMAETKQHMMTAEYIKRLREEIERLQNILLSFTSKVITWGNKKGYDTTELSLITILDEIKNAKAEIKAEAYKEAFEKVKEELKNIAKIDWQGVYYYLIGEAFFDNLLNELVGDDNA